MVKKLDLRDFKNIRKINREFQKRVEEGDYSFSVEVKGLGQSICFNNGQREHFSRLKNTTKFTQRNKGQTYLNKEIHIAVFYEIVKDLIPSIDDITIYGDIHHKDCNHTNNDPSNLEWMASFEHRLLHKELRSKT